MKKIILLAAFTVAGLVSAKTTSITYKIEEPKKDREQKIECKDRQGIQQQTQFNCISYTLSCGWPSFACGYSTIEILMAVWENDSNVCG
ncbi:hypothetical protein ACM39_15530 [Chryseobacterium sp. FH2]|uniref:hypothetical protein n=1 Tax=Chryseobacterium sp. FH2 TaxID=1674291 RepID=UPI00065A917C|nr:hypothetical protein [Chryseobacterium sp. FH2]KMQ67181.1 hypothetical protein ACM39_15530 [Chryseobacterium sp. FH2]